MTVWFLSVLHPTSQAVEVKRKSTTYIILGAVTMCSTPPSPPEMPGAAQDEEKGEQADSRICEIWRAVQVGLVSPRVGEAAGL